MRDDEWLVIKTELNPYKGIMINNKGVVYDVEATGERPLNERFIYRSGSIYTGLSFSTFTVENYDDPIEQHVRIPNVPKIFHEVGEFDGNLDKGDLYSPFNTFNHMKHVLASTLELNSDRIKFNRELVGDMTMDKLKQVEKEALQEAKEAYKNGLIDPSALNASYYSQKVSKSPMPLLPVSGDFAWTVDRDANVYLTVGASVGKSTNILKVAGIANKTSKLAKAERFLETTSLTTSVGVITGEPSNSIPGMSAGISVMGGKGGGINVTNRGDVSAEISSGTDIGASISISNTWYIGSLKD